MKKTKEERINLLVEWFTSGNKLRERDESPEIASLWELYESTYHQHPNGPRDYRGDRRRGVRAVYDHIMNTL